jgi:hypothetical protein
MNQYEREEDQLDRDLRDGLITQAEFRQQLRELQREQRGAAEEAAERAYNDTMGGW